MSMQLIDNTPAFWSEVARGKTGAMHKYDYGHTLLYAGWPGLGAAILAGKGVLRAGGGLLTVAVPSDQSAHTYLTALPEAIVETIRRPAVFKGVMSARKRNVGLIGPGAGQSEPSRVEAFLEASLQSADHVTVIDGDALTLLAGELKHLKPQIHPRVILTPHEGEFDRLYPATGPDKVSRTASAARALNAIIVHKGAETVIAHPDGRVVRTPAASPWLATAGTGDVLAGMIAGLAGWRGENPHAMPDLLLPVAAACYLHGLAAHLAGPGLIAGDIASHLPAAWRSVS